jgi:CheY-like chemotaxis protein
MDGFTLAVRIRAHPGLRDTHLFMLTSAGQRGDAARRQQMGIEVYLLKPAKQSALVGAIARSLGQPVPAAQAPSARTPPGKPRPKLRVLLAEDNAINWKLAIRLLEKQGHSVTVAGDGREAVAAIRTIGRSTGKHVPIVAMTAHAMKGGQECCLEAGMDSYISKPIQPARMMEAIASVTGPARETAAPAPAPN